MKQCLKCKRRLELNEENFEVSEHSVTGFRGTCKLCQQGLTDAITLTLPGKPERKIFSGFVPSQAMDMLTKAIYIDKIVAPAKTYSCSLCGDPARDYHHHHYTQEAALDVIPVCAACHAYIHSPQSPYPADYYTPEVVRNGPLWPPLKRY